MPGHLNGPGTGFISLNQYLQANQGNVAQDAGTLADAASTQAQGAETAADAVGQDVFNTGKATGTVDPTTGAGYSDALQKQQQAAQGFANLKTPGGIQTQLASAYGKQPGGYSAADQQFDARLQGASPDSQKAFDAASSKFGGLGSYLQDTTSAQAKAGNAAYQPPKDPAAAPAVQAKPVVGGVQVDPQKQAKVGMKLNPTGSAHGYQDDGDWTGSTFSSPLKPARASTQRNPFATPDPSDPAPRKKTNSGAGL